MAMSAQISDINQFTLDLGQGSELGMALALAMMMFSVALGLRPAHFAAIKDRPRAYVAGVVAGGNVSNMLVLLANGNTALSVSLTATSSLAAAFITPVSILFWSSLYVPTANLLTEIEFDAVSFLIQTSIILALPLLLGMLLLKLNPQLAQTIRKPLVMLSTAALFGIIIVASVRYWEMFVLLGAMIIGIVALHNASAFLLGYFSARLASASMSERRTLTFEVGIQNSGLGIVILLTQMGGLGGTAAIAGLWGVWHILAGLVLVVIFRKLVD